MLSVKRHDAYCLDNIQNQVDGFDHFWGDSLDARWRTTGTAAVVDAQDGGVLRLTTGATNGNSASIDWQDYRSLHVDKKVTMETRIKLGQVDDQYLYISLTFDVNNRLTFYESAGAAGGSWDVLTLDGGASSGGVSGVSLDTDYHIYKIEAFPTGEIHYYIDNVQCANSPITTNIPDDAADYLQPLILIQTKEDVAKTLDIDYVWWRQDR